MSKMLVHARTCATTSFLAIVVFNQNVFAGSGEAFAIVDPKIEGVAQPLGVEEAAPRFSWRYEAGTDAPRGFKQSGYRLQVASSAERLSSGKVDMWDSGQQEGSDTLSIIYAGKPLAAATRYFWKVTGFDGEGKSYTSQPQFFETGLLKAEDWYGAQWIGAKSERPETLPAFLQKLTDYTFETRFRILEGSATVLFRANYMRGREYSIEIQPGTPGKLILSAASRDAKPEIIKEYSIPSLAAGEWHTLQVTAKGDALTFIINNAAVGGEPLRDASLKSGSIALGAFTADKKKGLVQYDDFRLMVNGNPLVEEAFDNPVLFAFQEFFGSNTSYARVRNGVLETRGAVTYLEPKKDLEAPRFRKSFSANRGQVVRARAYVSGLGYYKFWLNGERMDDFYLNPGFARYDKTAYYCTYDITDAVQKENVMAFELGRGWYGMTTPTLWGETFSNDWMAEPALRVLITLEYANGVKENIVSDTSFKTAPGPILFDSVKAGEIYDARLDQPGWNTLDFDDESWKPAVVAKGNMPNAPPGLTAQLFEPIRAVERFTPVNIQKVEDETDIWQVDFGKNLAGLVEMKVKARPGQEIRLTHVERPNHGGRERWNNFGAERTGNFQKDTFVAKGGREEETFESSYSYKGFQFVRVEGLTEKPRPDQFVAKAINSDMVRVGKFTSSSELWNKIWEAGRRSIQSNMHSIPTDCPTWEKLGWTCDDSSPYYAMAFNYDLRKLYEKRLQDYADDISADGRIRNVLPSAWAKGEDPAWVGSYVDLVWKHYLTYGDRRVVERHYDDLKLYMSTLIREGEASEKPPLLTRPRRALGDWLSPEGTVPPEGALIYYDAYYYKYLKMMRDLATVLGRKEDVTYYGKLAGDVRKQFNAFFYDQAEGCYYSSNRSAGFRQSPQAVALAFGLVPDDQIPRVADRLVQDMEKRGDHIWTGILGMEAIGDALSENGKNDAAYKAHLKDDYPSVGNMIREGATTLWEDYAITKARSLNHKMYASPLGWLARYVAGLQVDGILGNGPGFREALIAPHPDPAQVQFAQLDYDSAVGSYRSGWRVIPEGMAYDVVVPPNATARLRLPLLGEKEATVSESGKVLWEDGRAVGSVPGISSPQAGKEHLEFILGSGIYAFQVRSPSQKAP